MYIKTISTACKQVLFYVNKVSIGFAIVTPDVSAEIGVPASVVTFLRFFELVGSFSLFSLFEPTSMHISMERWHRATRLVDVEAPLIIGEVALPKSFDEMSNSEAFMRTRSSLSRVVITSSTPGETKIDNIHVHSYMTYIRIN